MVVFEPKNICPEPISEETRAAFSSRTTPAWCSRVLGDPNLLPIATPSRQPKASTEDAFIAETLATANTISAWQSFYKKLLPPSNSSEADAPNDKHDTNPIAGELVSLLTLGRGTNGYVNVAHGGLISTILDQTMGLVVAFHESVGTFGYTAFMNVKFRKPVPTPGAVLCRSWLERRSGGRKLWVRGTVEDGEGGLFAEAESLWIEVEEKAQKL